MSEHDTTHRNLLYDLSYRLKDDALDALEEWRRSRESGDPTDKAFHDGQMLAYYKVLSVLKNHALTFDLPADDLNWGDFDPDRHLLRREPYPGRE